MFLIRPKGSSFCLIPKTVCLDFFPFVGRSSVELKSGYERKNKRHLCDVSISTVQRLKEEFGL